MLQRTCASKARAFLSSRHILGTCAAFSAPEGAVADAGVAAVGCAFDPFDIESIPVGIGVAASKAISACKDSAVGCRTTVNILTFFSSFSDLTLTPSVVFPF